MGHDMVLHLPQVPTSLRSIILLTSLLSQSIGQPSPQPCVATVSHHSCTSDKFETPLPQNCSKQLVRPINTFPPDQEAYNTKASGFIAFEDTTIVPSLVKAASGIVLDLGPGPGNQIHRFNIPAIDRIYGVEPNPQFANDISSKMEMHGLQGKYQLIVARIEDSDILREAGITEGSLDTVLCIQVLCAVKDPKAVMREIWKLLKPGGKFIFWEHGRSKNRVTRVTQGMFYPSS
jgi:SAM-dependent methyltransferase